MIGGNYAGTTAQIGLGALRRAAIPQNQPNLGVLMGEAIGAYNKKKENEDLLNKQQAYADALKSGDQEAIKNAWIDLDASGYADYANKQAETEAQRQFQRDLLRDKLNNDFALAKYKAQFDTAPQGTNAQQNVQAMIEAGYTPQEAWAMYYGGNNPTLDMATLGKKGQEAYDQATGERMAEKAEAMDLLGQTQSAYNDMFSKGGLVEQAQIGAGLPDTIAGRIGGAIDRAVPTTLVNSDAQKARQQIQYLMGGLRLNEASAMKGALSDSEQKFLSDMVAGNVKGYSPYEMQGAFEGIINKLKRKSGVPSLKQVNQLVTDPRVQEALDNGYSMEEIQKYLGK